MLSLNTNLNSMDARRDYDTALSTVTGAIARLSSGIRINSARDDAAGMAITERMQAQIQGLNQAARNVNDGISMMQVAEGALSQLDINFQRIRTLAVQAANATYTSTDRLAMQKEVDQLVAQDKTITSQTEFNGIKLLDGSLEGVQLQIGANSNQVVQLDLQSALKQPSTTITTVDAPLYQSGVNGQVTTALGNGDLTINGAPIPATVAGAQAGQSSSSAWAIANAINQTPASNVTASASNSFSGNDVYSSANIPANGLIINGVAIGAISGADGNAVTASAVNAINAVSAQTGVTASSTVGFATGGPHNLPANTPDSVLTLSTSDGRDIIITEAGVGYANHIGQNLGVHHGKIAVETAISTAANSIVISGNHPDFAGLNAGTTLASPTGQTVPLQIPVGSGGEPSVDVTSSATAQQAISYADTKIQFFNDLRAYLGANQNRLEMTSADLSGTSDNLSAARSRIRDTDYAADTATLTREQILREASTAMLAQANALPRDILRLLLP